MRWRFLALAGLLLGLLLVVFATVTAHTAALQSFRDADQQARIAVPTRVLLKGEAETITIRVTNTDTVECDLTLSLVAPAFTLTPADNQQLVQLTPTTLAELHWSVRPTTTGTATLAVTTGSTSEQLGVSVISGTGDIASRRATANYLGILFGALLAVASLLWWSALQSRGARSAPQSAPNSPPTSPDPPQQP